MDKEAYLQKILADLKIEMGGEQKPPVAKEDSVPSEEEPPHLHIGDNITPHEPPLGQAEVHIKKPAPEMVALTGMEMFTSVLNILDDKDQIMLPDAPIVIWKDKWDGKYRAALYETFKGDHEPDIALKLSGKYKAEIGKVLLQTLKETLVASFKAEPISEDQMLGITEIIIKKGDGTLAKLPLPPPFVGAELLKELVASFVWKGQILKQTGTLLKTMGIKAGKDDNHYLLLANLAENHPVVAKNVGLYLKSGYNTTLYKLLKGGE